MKVAYGLSPDEQATWKYEVISETFDHKKYIVKAVNHPDEGLLIISKDKLGEEK